MGKGLMPSLLPGNNLEFGRPPDPDFVFAWNYYRMARSEKNQAWLELEQPSFGYFLKEYSRNSSVLEIGIGAGNLTNLLLKMGFDEEKITGVDPNKYLLNKYKEEHPKIRALTASITGLNPHFKESFDLILAHMVLNHVPTVDLEAAFIEVFSVLKEGGDFLFMIPDTLEKADKHGFDDKETAMKATEVAPWGGFVTYYHHSFEKLMFLLKKVGFSEVEILCQPMYGEPLNSKGYMIWSKSLSVYSLKELPSYLLGPKRALLRARV